MASPTRAAQCLDSSASEDGVEARRELRVPIPDEISEAIGPLPHRTSRESLAPEQTGLVVDHRG
jgi:hypothetical protein